MGETPKTADAPLVLVAKAGRARMRAPFTNRGRARVRPGAAEIEGLEAIASSSGGLRPARVRGSVAPGERGEVRISIRIDRSAPPGEHDGTIQVGGEQVPVRVVVPERRQVRILPRRLTVDVTPGARIERTLVLENRGNVPFCAPRRFASYLEPRDRMCGVLREGFKDAADVQSALDGLARAAAGSLDADALLLVTLPEGPLEVAPGEIATFPAVFAVPRSLPAGEYSAFLRVADVPLRVRVCCTREGEGEEE